MRKKSLLNRALIFVLVAVLVLGGVATANATDIQPQKEEKPYEIAVAYDNSGSMYGKSGKWCYAKYAMEIFASMMDLTGRDKLTVFTMHSVSTVGSTGTKRIEVKSVSDIDKIHKMSTTSPGGTPFKPVIEAYQYLKSADINNEKERWLIVLTDGSFEGIGSDAKLKSELKKLSDGTNINVQYIPFGGTVLNDSNPNDAFHASPNITGNDALRNELVSICNKIFRRDELKDRLDGQTLNIDLSMKRIIVFVQGEGASVTGLKDSGGNSVKILMDSGKRTYSKYSSEKNTLAMPKDVINQSGQVVTFGACTRGTYTLEYSNAETIQIFYEPDVTLKTEFINADGVPEDFSDKEIPPGEYTFNAQLVDRVTGEDVSTHELLGGNVNIDAKIKYDGEKDIDLKPGDKVDLKPGKDVDFSITATYLDRYKLTDKDCPDLPDFSGIEIKNPVHNFTIKADIKQPNSWYVLKDHANWKPIRLNLKMNGKPLTDEQLEKADLKIVFKGPNKNLEYYIEPLHGKSAVNVYIGSDENGNFTQPQVGEYVLKASAKTVDKYGVEVKTSKPAEAKFNIEKYGFGFEILKRIILAIIILAAAVFVLGFPVKPRAIFIQHSGELYGFRGNELIELPMSEYDPTSVFTASVKTHWVWIKNSWVARLLRSKGMDCIFSDISVNDEVENLTLVNGKPICKVFAWKNADGSRINATITVNREP